MGDSGGPIAVWVSENRLGSVVPNEDIGITRNPIFGVAHSDDGLIEEIERYLDLDSAQELPSTSYQTL